MPAHAGSVAWHDRADFAQEFLRRSARYRIAWARCRDVEPAFGAADEARRWGLVRLFDPDRPVRSAPAIWRAEAASQVVTLAPAPPGFADGSPLPGLPLLSEQLLPGERHLVADVAGVRHRLRLLTADDSVPLAILLAPLSDAIRVAACDAARRMFAGLSVMDAAAPLRPSALQRHRLALLLRVLDASLAGAGNREIGLAIVYPWLARTDAVAWKATSERRRVQRLIAEARGLAAGGYRGLLRP